MTPARPLIINGLSATRRGRVFTGRWVEVTRYLMLPGLLMGFGALTFSMKDSAFARQFPHYAFFLVFLAMLTLERVYTYRRAVSQRRMVWRDLISTLVQTFIAGALMGMVFVRVLHWMVRSFLGRDVTFGAAHSLGPIWAQVLAVFLLASLWGYWMHRFQHYHEFFWKLHGYHHSVTHVQISNLLVSNPIDWALRNLLGGILLNLVGFSPVALAFAGIIGLYANFSHCGGDMKAGWLSYFFNTPELHRWHHSAEFPDQERFRYGCNFGVETSLWDLIFGTFYLPRDEKGQVASPPRIGHPSGYTDESNYLKILLADRVFPAAWRFFGREDRLPSVSAE